ncbi:hypothetical protein LWI29_017427 [Acer saccharum]|uniref:Uncharacterized protein n=1 Tax=Acer saccharum TaxID=4024 RepID=A0AA39TMU4_ACESA|nr:hypothetical protein LWI29_017427 [Acer saccharum]
MIGVTSLIKRILYARHNAKLKNRDNSLSPNGKGQQVRGLKKNSPNKKDIGWGVGGWGVWIVLLDKEDESVEKKQKTSMGDLFVTDSTEPDNIILECLSYFDDLFSFSSPSVEELGLCSEAIECKMDSDMRRSLERAFVDKEVQLAAFSLGPMKAPGLDGFHAIFFKKF